MHITDSIDYDTLMAALTPLSGGALACGIVIVIATFISAILCGLLFSLYIKAGHYLNYVTLLAALICVQELNSFVMQVIQLATWTQMQEKMLSTQNLDVNPKLEGPYHIAYFSLLILEIYCINVQGLLFLWWSMLLCSSIWNVCSRWRSERVIALTKGLSFALPMIQVIMVAFEGSKKTGAITSPVIVNVIFAASTGLGSIFLALILVRLVTLRRAVGRTNLRISMQNLDRINVNIGKEQDLASGVSINSQIENRNAQWDTGVVGHTAMGTGSWLLIRVSLAFLITMGLQAYVVWIEFYDSKKWVYYANWANAGIGPAPQQDQMRRIAARLPSCLTGLLFFITFGTTQEMRSRMAQIFAPLCLWCRNRRGGTNYKRKNSEPFIPLTLGSRASRISRRDISYPNPHLRLGAQHRMAAQNMQPYSLDSPTTISSRQRGHARDSTLSEVIMVVPASPLATLAPRPRSPQFPAPPRPSVEAPIFNLSVFSPDTPGSASAANDLPPHEKAPDSPPAPPTMPPPLSRTISDRRRSMSPLSTLAAEEMQQRDRQGSHSRSRHEIRSESNFALRGYEPREIWLGSERAGFV